MSVTNANALLHGARSTTSYHQAIQIKKRIRKQLVSADREIRAALRERVAQIKKSGQTLSLASREYRRLLKGSLDLELRFLRQGSFVYDTAIDPANRPPQKNDLDDGIYAHTSFLAGQEPDLAAAKYFELVEAALKALCERRGWTLVEKDSCVRVVISEFAHIDLPLYAIPDAEFGTLEKALRDATGLPTVQSVAKLSSLMDRYPDLRLPSHCVMLAHRKKGWIPSDPRLLHDWFEENVRRYGPQLRRESRYCKGWRDLQFETGGPSSIALMACVVRRYQEGDWEPDESRDDLALLEIASGLAVMFEADIPNPALPNGSVLNDWDDVRRQRYIKAARSLHSEISNALNGTANSEIVVKRFRNALGARVPYRPDLVKMAEISAPNISTSAKVIGAPLPLVGPTTSG